MRTFHLLVANTLVANVTNNFLWFALTFWVYLETRSVLATAVIGGGYMLLIAISAMFFGTYVDRHLRRTSMLLSSALSLSAFALAGLVFVVAPDSALRDLSQPFLWAFIALVLGGAIAGNLRSVALSTTVTLLVPEEGRDRANGLVGTANGVAFALTSVFSGLAVGQLGMGACVLIAVVVTALATVHLMTIRIEEEAPTPSADAPRMIDVRGAIRAVGLVPGLLGLLLFSMFNNFLGGVFMSLMDPYGLTLMSVEAWGFLIAFTSLGFIVGGIFVARRGLGVNPVQDAAARERRDVERDDHLSRSARRSCRSRSGSSSTCSSPRSRRRRSRRSSRRSCPSRSRAGSSVSRRPSRPRRRPSPPSSSAPSRSSG